MPSTIVAVTLCGITGHCTASPDGRFIVNLPPMPAMKNQRLTGTNAGIERCCEDISIGEVYLVGGHSNMEFPLSGSNPGAESVSEADFEKLRYFKISAKNHYGPQRTLYGQWQKIFCSSANKISGCVFFFGRAIAEEIGVVVGLVEASLGGINIESWVSREALLEHPAYRQELLDYERIVSLRQTEADGKIPTFSKMLADGLKKLFPEPPDDNKFEAGWAKEDFCDQDWDSMLLPDSWTEAEHNHAGGFWFRRTVELPVEWAGQELEIHLGLSISPTRSISMEPLLAAWGRHVFGITGRRNASIRFLRNLFELDEIKSWCRPVPWPVFARMEDSSIPQGKCISSLNRSLKQDVSLWREHGVTMKHTIPEPLE